MRFVFAIISFVLAAVLIGYGIAQRTVLLEPDEISLSATAETAAPVTIVDGAALNAFEGRQTLRLEGSGEVFAAYGRTADVLAWVGDTDHTVIGFDAATGELTTEFVPGDEDEVPDPAGSDLWLEEYDGNGSIDARMNVPADVSVIAVSDGAKAAPGEVQVTWPVDNSTPWSGPLIIAGAVVLLLGLALLLWAIHHMRRSRGPRRKSTSLPKVPRKPLYKPGRKPAAKPTTGRRATRGMIAVPITLAVASMVLTGCTMPSGGSAAPTPTPSLPAEATVDPPAVTVPQLERIIEEVSETVATAAETKDTELLATRLDGAALELRTANYAITTADTSIVGMPLIPAGPVKLTLPQQTDTWPRTVFAVIQDETDATIAPVALFLEQADPRSNYKVVYEMTLEPAAVLPDVAPADLGAARLDPEDPVLRLTPTEIALAYADILEKDVDSESYLDFQAEGDSLREAVGLAAKNSIRSSLPATASVAFGHSIGTHEAIALAANDAGALIAVTLNETTTVTPIEAGAAVNPSGQVKALSGLAISTVGVKATYSDQLLFYVPPPGGNGKIVLLGYTQGLVAAGEI